MGKGDRLRRAGRSAGEHHHRFRIRAYHRQFGTVAAVVCADTPRDVRRHGSDASKQPLHPLFGVRLGHQHRSGTGRQHGEEGQHRRVRSLAVRRATRSPGSMPDQMVSDRASAATCGGGLAYRHRVDQPSWSIVGRKGRDGRVWPAWARRPCTEARVAPAGVQTVRRRPGRHRVRRPGRPRAALSPLVVDHVMSTLGPARPNQPPVCGSNSAPVRHSSSRTRRAEARASGPVCCPYRVQQRRGRLGRGNLGHCGRAERDWAGEPSSSARAATTAGAGHSWLRTYRSRSRHRLEPGSS